jgi:glycine oxidase
MPEVVIVGGGVIGLSISYELARRGESVRVVDYPLGRHQTSWAATGILPPANADAAYDAYGRLCGLSCRLHTELAERLADETELDVGYRRCGGLYLARTSGESVSLRSAAGQWADDGNRVEVVEVRELPRRFPVLREAVASGQIRAACWLPDEAQVRTPRLLKALRIACQKQGVDISVRGRVLSIVVQGGQVVAVKTTADEVRGDRFCVAAGAWSESILQEVGRPIETQPWRGQIVLMEAANCPFNFVVNEGPNYLVPRDDGLVLVGSTVEEVGFDDRVTDDAIEELVRYARNLIPDLAEARCLRSWAGLRPGSPDGFPYLGRVPHLPNLYVATGHFRSGVYLSPATARVMSQLMRGETPDVDLELFRLDR